MKNYDVIIIGGGPIGIACGLEAKKANISYLIIEKGPIVNSLFNYPINMQFFSSSEKLEIDEIPFISKESKPKRNEALAKMNEVSAEEKERKAEAAYKELMEESEKKGKKKGGARKRK